MKNFIISLDFELLWGVKDSRGIEYHEQLHNVHQVIPKLLSLFEEYDVSCTWAVVGFLCSTSKSHFQELKPRAIPTYDNIYLSPYTDIDDTLKLDNRLLFAPDLIKHILNTPHQELASHTFCHYYCLEPGQTLKQFNMDLHSNNMVANSYNTSFQSLVFPRNQINKDYLVACAEAGIICYRGNPSHWAYQAESRETRSTLNRAYRLLDCYIPLSGSLRQKVKLDLSSGIVDVPASLFFRPYSHKLRFLDSLKLWRLKWSMTRTAKKGGVFHLWWHPHNFGRNMHVNLKQLEEILKHYNFLNKKYNFKSLTMEQAAKNFLEDNI
jgi:hypothetical protein